MRQDTCTADANDKALLDRITARISLALTKALVKEVASGVLAPMNAETAPVWVWGAIDGALDVAASVAAVSIAKLLPSKRDQPTRTLIHRAARIQRTLHHCLGVAVDEEAARVSLKLHLTDGEGLCAPRRRPLREPGTRRASRVRRPRPT